MELILTEAYHKVYKNKFHIDEFQVYEAFNLSTAIQKLENNVTLHLKEFKKGRYAYLLLATQLVKSEILFSFAYWIPSELISQNVPLLDVLKMFAHNYGCKIKIGTTEGYFIENTRRLIHGNLESPNQLMEILGSVHIPCESYVFYNEKNENNLHWVDCYYCFAINNNKYLLWLEDIETTKIPVPREWYTYLKEITETLNPYGGTGLKILNNKRENNDGLVSHSEEQTSEQSVFKLEIPKTYLQPFTRIIDLVSSLGKGEKIIVIPQHESNKCIFCGSSEVSQEHIFAQWMRAYFPEKKFASTLYARTPDDKLLETLKSGVTKGTESSYGYTSHMVCAECNSTWMSQLEEKAKGILVDENDVFREKISELKLDDQNSKQLALWLIVKSILLSLKGNLSPKLPDNALSDIKNDDIPEGFIIEIAEVESSDIDFIVNKGINAFADLLSVEKLDKRIAEDIANEFFMVNIQVHHFIFRVTYLDESRGLKREAWIRPTKILYPKSYRLRYKKIENEQELWDRVENNLKLHVFNIGLKLIDH